MESEQHKHVVSFVDEVDEIVDENENDGVGESPANARTAGAQNQLVRSMEQGFTSTSKVLVRTATLPMKFFIDSRQLDEETATMLRDYDIDGDGIFSKEEVVAILLEVRQRSKENAELRQWNRFYKKMTLTMAVVFVVLLLGFMGLSMAVTVMTARLDVNAEGVAVSASDPNIVIATNDRATMYEIRYSLNNNGGSVFCISDDTAESIISTTSTTGKKVSLVLAGGDENSAAEQVIDLHLATAAVDRSSGQTTYEVAGRTLHMQANEACGIATGGERRIGVTWL